MKRANKKMGAGLYRQVATKLSAENRAKLEIVANGFNMSVYELLQGLILSFIRYFDIASTITHEHNTMMNAFANVLFALKDSFNPLAQKGCQTESIAKAILLIERPHKQPQLISVCKDGCGNLKESYNFETMLIDFLGAFDPEALQVLTQIKTHLGYFSLTHSLHEIILQSKPAPADTMSEEIKLLFADERIATGDKPNEDVHYKRIRNNDENYTAPTMRKRKVRTSYLNI